MQNHIKQFLFIFIFLTLTLPLIGRDKRVNQIPNGNVNSCSNCHANPNGGGTRTEFGELVRTKFLDSNGDVIWNAELASIDADGDGISNGDELQDQFGSWSAGESAPGTLSSVSNPGDNNSTKLQIVTVHLSSMAPHAGNKFFIRAIDKSNGIEASRKMIPSLLDDQNIDLDNLIVGHSYTIDFFADNNGNSIYDPPPTDHAWRLEANIIQGGETIEFAHDINFIDIDWRYQLTINFHSMTPHIGEMLEFSVEDDSTSMEAGRMKIASVPSADFSQTISGLKLNREYKIKIYADHNGNGIYDNPPTDHAWRVDFTNHLGDATVDFIHNTDFKDVGWKYLYTLNLLGMKPHLGKMLELRVVRSDNGEEVGRKKIMDIPQSNFSVSIDDIELDHDYRVDFYADHNGNGNYNAPPTDHAWRTTFNTSMGNLVENFTHNTNFTDIEWPITVDVNDDKTLEPTEYTLEQNYPNPFNPSTTINYGLKSASNVKLTVYNLLGQEVVTLVNQHQQAGNYGVQFDASYLTSGTYIYKITAGEFVSVKKLLLLK